MTIDEAIFREERNVEINKLIGEVSDCEPTNAIDYHRQLVEWLKELKKLKQLEEIKNETGAEGSNILSHDEITVKDFCSNCTHAIEPHNSESCFRCYNRFFFDDSDVGVYTSNFEPKVEVNKCMI